jgi:hypothetical protein
VHGSVQRDLNVFGFSDDDGDCEVGLVVDVQPIRFLVGDLLTGRRIQWLQAEKGTWSEELNQSGEVQCSVLLSDPVNARQGIPESAAVGKAFLAAVMGDLVLQAGPIWKHDWDDDNQRLTLTAAGMWSYFDHRVLLPDLDLNPTDPATDTRFSPIVSDPDAVGYPWLVDTRESWQAIAKRLVEQAQAWTNGNVPVILPDEEPGENARWFKGSALAFVGPRLREITALEAGPDIMFTPRWTSDHLGIEWVMRIGTPSEPLLFSAQRQKFQVGVDKSSVTDLRVKVDGSQLASTSYASAGKSDGQALITVSEDSTLPDLGYPALDAVDKSHSTVSEEGTLQAYSDELALMGRKPVTVWSFSHRIAQSPYLESFNAGDFALVSLRRNAYLQDGEYLMRLLARSGDITGEKVALQFTPEVSGG